ncbi:MAG: radical SAM protein [Magnetococcales bacterium]|nr:radical SAM protein [Magnetococcales bacterium]
MVSQYPLDDLKEYLRRRINIKENYDALLRFPRYFEIETVNHCNAHCPICTVNDWKRQSGLMSDHVFDKIAEEITTPENTQQIIRVSLFRDGEPLLDKKLSERIARLKNGGIKHVSITTNVSLLDPKRAMSLLDSKLDSIVFSLDSIHKETYELIRVGLNYEEVMNNALNFIRMRDESKAKTKIQVRMTRQQLNKSEWNEFHAFWRNNLREQDRVFYHDVHNWGGQNIAVSLLQQSGQIHLPCVALWSLCVIFANGDIPLCNVDYMNNHGNGNVMNQSIYNLWNSPLIQQRRQDHLNGNKGKITLCQTCNAWEEPSDSKNIMSHY